MEFTRVPPEVLAGLEPIVRKDIAWWEAVLTACCGATQDGVLREDEIPQPYRLHELSAAYQSFYHPSAAWNDAVRDGQPALWVASDDQLRQLGDWFAANRVRLSQESAKLLRYVLAANKKVRKVGRTDEEFAVLKTAFARELSKEGARRKGLEAQLLGDDGVLFTLLRIVGEYHSRPAEEVASITRMVRGDSSAAWIFCSALYEVLRRREAQDAGRQDTDDTSECLVCGESHRRTHAEEGLPGFNEKLDEVIQDSLKNMMGNALDLNPRRADRGEVLEVFKRVFGPSR